MLFGSGMCPLILCRVDGNINCGKSLIGYYVSAMLIWQIMSSKLREKVVKVFSSDCENRIIARKCELYAVSTNGRDCWL